MEETLKRLGNLLFGLIDTFHKMDENERAQSSNNNNGNNNNNNMISPSSIDPKIRAQNAAERKQLRIVLANTLCCLSHLMPGIKNVKPFWIKFVELITFEDSDIQSMVLDTLFDIISVDSYHTAAVIEIGLLTELKKILNHKNNGIRTKVLNVLSVIVKDRGFVEVQ